MFWTVLSAVIKGKLISVCVAEDNSILAFSAASFRLCNANLSCFKSIALSFLNSSQDSLQCEHQSLHHQVSYLH